MACFLQTSAPANDLDLSSGNLVVVDSLAQETAQKLSNKFQLFLGEWFIDTRIGVPWFQQILIKNPDLSAVGQLFRKIILNTPGVASILQADLTMLTSQRKLIASFKVLVTDGSIIEGGPGVPFIVTGTEGGVS